MTIIIAGATILVFAIKKYYKMLQTAKEEEYHSQTSSAKFGMFSLILMFIFMGGFLVGFVDMIVRDVEPIYMFVVTINLLGVIFIHSTINTEFIMLGQLRQKTLETMRTFVNLIEMKDEYTRGHSQHVYNIVAVFYDSLDSDIREKINRTRLLDAAMLHDIGKIGIADEVLNKPGKLTDEDWELIRKHPLNGKKMLDDTCFIVISGWVLYHHERMDGKGYYKLPGNDIPLESRIIAIADTYSALRTNRVYRSKKTHEMAIEIMKEESGKQFDPELLEIFCKIDPENFSDFK